MAVTLDNILNHIPRWYSILDKVEGANNTALDVTIDNNGNLINYPEGPANRPLSDLRADILNLYNIISVAHNSDGSHTGKIVVDDLDCSNSPINEYLLSYDEANNKFKWVEKNITDEKVKCDPNDPTPGYISEKIDTSTLEVDDINHVIKVKSNIYAPINHSHTPDQVGLANVVNKLQISVEAAEFASILNGMKSTPTDDDLFIIEDSQTNFSKKYTTLSAIKNSPSDIRLKKDIQNLEYSLNDICKLNPIQFSYKNEEKIRFGLVAQELKEIIPEIVEEDKDGYLSIRYQELIPVLIKAIQKLKEEIEKLKQKIK